MNKPTLGIVGGGIAGLGIAYQLRDAFDIAVFEKDSCLGGHIRPAFLESDSESGNYIDTGFLAYEPSCYPNFNRLLSELGVETIELTNDITVWDRLHRHQYKIKDFLSLCGSRFDRRAATDMRRLLVLLMEFEKNPSALDDCPMGLGEYFEINGYHPDLVEHLIIPAIAVTWGFQDAQIRAMAISTAMRELSRYSRPPRRPYPTSNVYLSALLSKLDGVRFYQGVNMVAVTEKDTCVCLAGSAGVNHFDYVVIAVHADQALRLLTNPTADQKRFLGGLTYHRNLSIVHSDTSLLPEDASTHTAFTLTILDASEGPDWIVTWALNDSNLSATGQRVFVSVGDARSLGGSIIDPRLTHQVFENWHPSLTLDFFSTQRQLERLNQGRRLFFSGSYFGFLGSHECAYTSALDVSARLRAMTLAT